ncbi:thymidylate kinase [Mycobacteroides abscessus subsp. bolletii 1S-154-0310]|uniref:Spermatogenesis-associated protein 20-like TRX domain-containing protein n=1 Tax=Mycobacteroides abscessus MAB_091912_2446 TaxID=1335414 RepID=A0A829M8V0_9MYCO|nr:thymidylate kinase [Mycobacteroides abscessus subsp. bolletii 1S-151-0930]EIU70655.1 thymidylate kinase [Mycobacteroides abscessus subsp. bolletii 1S-152-0914]EIU81786.1 thymidylate kinase [Mycobacteroides abscessus subsp. bolletii 1S-153-0915]EIU84615.1 thymidylate kinase [Mycobacteroides abscessus subsp. bolletii 1S-154-0310]EIU86344.1 thymidylate kinase [Mycobacteroides abscessus subsp. bolletii 2B-0626]EIV14729.1 thymidylate kinase [Mycobacteroides abscessus subsp. bolletii 2B-0912-R]E
MHWQQWNPEALAEAQSRDVPILLSIGYAACHWCHVMAHESFEDDEVAAVMNAGFVNIKVDREERPDLDAVYMNATVAMNGQGGWPMTCFLTPDGRPFYTGTYYPKQGFLQLLSAVREAWERRRDEVEEAASSITGQLQAMSGRLPAGPGVDIALCDTAIAAILPAEDVRFGGFGGAPKFPPSALLEALLRGYERTGDAAVLAVVARTAAAMARGGIYDQLAGGFARYSVDAAWVVPHFEKMLYDNALLLRFYGHLARRTGDALARRIASETADFLLNELRAGELFVSSLDADADGSEGSTYVWTPEQLAEVLGPDDGAWAATLFEVTPTGTFEHGSSVLQLLRDPEDAARWQRVRQALLAARLVRVQPGRDDKAVTAWNGLAITALVEASVALDRDDLLEAAGGCAAALLELHLRDGRLRRASLGGQVSEGDGVLEDYGTFATGLLSLYQLTGQWRWREAAAQLLDTALDHFADPDSPGAWFDVADDAEQLVLRPSDPLDGATPSGASSVTEALLTAGYLLEDPRYREAAYASLAAASMALARAPRSAGHWLAVAEAAVRGPIQVAVACDAATSALLRSARLSAPGGAIVVGGVKDSSELLRDRGQIGDADAAYVCRGTVCDLPVTGTQQLDAALGR